MRRFLYILLGILLVGIVVFLLGPKPDYPEFNPEIQTLNWNIEDLDSLLVLKESGVPNLKSNNQSRVVWADSVRKTPFAIVYLHGFSASPMEADPVHVNFAKRYGCNLYLPRLAGHGLSDKESFLELTPKDLVESAKEAIAIGQLIGDKVILLSTSTGGTLSIYLSAYNPDQVHGQILLSPNIDLFAQITDVLTYPWGLEIAQLLNGEYNHIRDIQGEGTNYWTMTYRIEGVLALKYLMEATMTKTVFEKMETPFFLGYYYKNEEEQDHVVSVDAMKVFYEQAGTPEKMKREKAFPDAGHHVIGSRFKSQSIPAVEEGVYQYVEEVLGMEPRGSEE